MHGSIADETSAFQPDNFIKKVSQSQLCAPIDIIGPGATYEDPYGDFARLCLPDETGALLVRPDLFLAWRVAKAPADLVGSLRLVLDKILSNPSAESADGLDVAGMVEATALA